jgi:L-lactate dehydrogenase complex protein LldE
MLSQHYPACSTTTPTDEAARRESPPRRSYELRLVPGRRAGREERSPRAAYDGAVTYHDSCSGLRELGVKAQPRALLESASRAALARNEHEPEVCCGFGGTFCVKYPDISNAMVGEKSRPTIAAKTGADTLLAGDLGCLMNMAGKLQREGSRGQRCAMSPRCWPA